MKIAGGREGQKAVPIRLTAPTSPVVTTTTLLLTLSQIMPATGAESIDLYTSEKGNGVGLYFCVTCLGGQVDQTGVHWSMLTHCTKEGPWGEQCLSIEKATL